MKVIKKEVEGLKFWADGGVVETSTPTLDDLSGREVVSPAYLIRATYDATEMERRRRGV